MKSPTMSRSIGRDFTGAFRNANWVVINRDYEGSRFARALVALSHPKCHPCLARYSHGAAERAQLFALRRERYSFDSEPWALCPGWIRPPISRAQGETLRYWPFVSLDHYCTSLRDCITSSSPELAWHIRGAASGNAMAMTAQEIHGFVEHVSELLNEGLVLYEQRSRLVETLPFDVASAEDRRRVEPALRSLESRERALLEQAGFLANAPAR